MNPNQVVQILRERRYKPSFVAREGGSFVAYVDSWRGVNDRTLETRFRKTRLEVVGYGHCVVNGHFIRLRERV